MTPRWRLRRCFSRLMGLPACRPAAVGRHIKSYRLTFGFIRLSQFKRRRLELSLPCEIILLRSGPRRGNRRRCQVYLFRSELVAPEISCRKRSERHQEEKDSEQNTCAPREVG